MKFSSCEMNKFLAEFVPSYYKYFGCNQVPDWALDQIGSVVEKEHKSSILAFSKITSNDLVNAYKISEAVYADSKRTKEFVDLYTNVQGKFVEEFVGIQGLDELYQPLFFVFEWMMHLEYLPEKDSYSYYRDHFVHQVRNMFEMFMIFSSEELEVLQRCIDFFEQDNSLLARYVRAAVDNECKDHECLSNLDELYESCPSETGISKRNAIYRYLLLASVVVTSLIHDIGYPIQFLNDNLKRIEGFLPISSYFVDTQDRTSEIYMILQDSLLFQSVDSSEIKKMILKGDHGTISACTLLLKYYTNGKIHAMNSLQRCIIELSALTIYNHTLKYRINGDDSNLYQNVFEDNPFSFWFRVCDDIEEWDRVYFDITKQSNFLICEDCKTVIRRMNRGKNSKQYSCCCGKKGENDNLFKYRKLAHVNACDEVFLGKIENDNKVILNFNYDLMSLLQASSYNASFASKRAKGIIETKKMVFGQSGYVPVYVDAFISGNPIAIKTEITLQYMKNQEEIDLKSESLNFDAKNSTNVVDSCFSKEILKDIGFVDNTEAQMKTWYGQRKGAYEVVKENLMFYGSMAILTNYLRQLEPSEKIINEVEKISTYICEKNKIFQQSLRELVCDCVRQAVYYVSYEQFQKNRFIYQDEYFKMQKASELDVSLIESYIKSELYDLVRLRCKKMISSDRDKKYMDEVEKNCKKYGIELEECKLDFYSDYYAFLQMDIASKKIGD